MLDITPHSILKPYNFGPCLRALNKITPDSNCAIRVYQRVKEFQELHQEIP
jgi:hypothetical protein